MAFAARRSGGGALLMMLAVAAAVVGPAGADFAADKAECADKLMGLATCLTYVQLTATARAPTPDCCSGFRQVLGTSKRCMCILVKDRDEPALGIKVNITRSMNLPSVCNIAATFSDCPKILNMAPDSKETEIFKQYAREHEGKNAATTSPTAAAATATGTAAGKSVDATSGAGRHTVVFATVVSALLASAFVLA
ncbi:non-specific lipid transfer protein GPI-anchored 14 [Aegilops tauschii subsp. strangulata]|uniref:Bifunctional inhibitor/plant lipid transfer protein/seed storage helical domain-containing protein n=1 Tax=Triticum aestivum TaxID=4565 RepID=A0A3B6N1C6_WHEAT|nr:non-specific lipid transfer protein GPI-anchored 13 [Aegilops tauschii subsp. strangulata]XP_044399739.1 non-specific lipid transfer protein GPI-anchored 13-like [Triticum aestivum]